MIYIFQGVQSICSLPGMACSACANLCKQINCTICADCCSNVGLAVKMFFTKPLSTFVIIAFVMSGVQAYLSITALSSNCTFQAAWLSFSPFVIIEIGFAVINIIFAFYFQHQVWKKIMQLVTSDDHKAKLEDVHVGPTRAEQAKAGLAGGFAKLTGKEAQDNVPLHPTNPEGATKVKIHKDTVQAAFRSTFLEDFGVLAYFFALIGVFVISWFGSTWAIAGGQPCDGTKSVASLGMAFFIVAFLYTVAYYCCTCCAATVEINKAELEAKP